MKISKKLLPDVYAQLLRYINSSETVIQLKNEYHSKPTIKYGCWSIAGILFFYFSLAISDEAANVESSLAQINARLLRVEQVQSEMFWFERLSSEQANSETIKNAIRRADTKSLAKAQMQSNFTAFAKKELQQARVNVSDPIYFGKYYGNEIFTVSVELRGRMKKGAELKVLESLATSPFLQEVEKLDLEFQQNRQLHLVIKSYFFISE